MQKLIDNIINELYTADEKMLFVFPVHEVVKIIERVAEDYNDGWILCNDEMPPERESIFARFKGTCKWSPAMFETTSDDVQATLIYSDGTVATAIMHTTDGEWRHNQSDIVKNFRVIAWKPMSRPMKLKQEYLDEMS